MKSLLLPVALCLSCAQPKPAATPSPSQAPDAPFIVKWVEGERTPTSVALTARVERRSPLSAPIKVEVRPPAGARVTGAELSFSIPPNDAPGTTDATYLIRFDTVPSEDLVLTADFATETSGAHAQDVYRFGRPAPAGTSPKADGPNVRVGGQDLGPSVPLQKP